MTQVVISPEAKIVSGRTYEIEELGRFYDLIMRIGNTTLDRQGLIDKLIVGSAGWHTTRYKNERLNLDVISHWWNHRLAIDEFLDNVKIKHRGELVYRANVWRYDSAVQEVRVVKQDREWQEAILELNDSYA